jgi:magnesium-transporting ATPase (P-type)
MPKPATPPPVRQTHLNVNHPSLQYSFLTPEETASRLRTDLHAGLADHQDYLHRRSIHGLNQLQDDDPEPLYIKFLNQFKESPLILLLLASAAVSVLMGNVDDAISITLVLTRFGDEVDFVGYCNCVDGFVLMGSKFNCV